LFVDINGASGPNRMGRDVFAFTLMDNKIIPFSQYNYDMPRSCQYFGNIGSGGTSGQCNKTAQGGIFSPGSYCSTVIFCHNWTFPKNYPWN
jgi:hypothetical protein